jgi:hypothetical protein
MSQTYAGSRQAYPLEFTIPVKLHRKFKKGSSMTKPQPSRMSQREAKITRQPMTDALQLTVLALLNTRVTRASESKDGMLISHTYAPEVVGVAKSLFSPSKTYMFRIHVNPSITASGAGALTATIGFVASATSAYEWSALASLFDECALRRYRLRVTSALGQVSTTIPVTLAVAYNPINVSTVPTNLASVSRFPKFKQVHTYLGDGGSGSWTFAGKSEHRGFAQTASTQYSITPPCGLLGSIDYTAYANGTNSAIYGNCLLSLDVCFRTRA